MALHLTHSDQETLRLGQALGQALRGGELIAFTGGMGAGKTTFCRGIAAGLGCVDPVSSPTFAIVQYYRGRIPFAHFDAWRIQGPDDLEAAGLYGFLDEGAVVAVEWSERLAGLAHEADIRVDIRPTSPAVREILIEGVAGL